MRSSALCRALLALVAYLTSTATALGGCYNYNGTDRNDDAWDVGAGNIAYLPCNNAASFSMCCRLNDGDDTCLPNGLCTQGGSNAIWRESCSDPTWKSPSCLKLCVSENVGDMEVSQCPDQSWCCQGGPNNLNATTCCAQGKGSWIVNGKVTNVKPNSSSTSSSTSSTSPSTSSTSSFSSSSSSATNGPVQTGSTQPPSNIAAVATGTQTSTPKATAVASTTGGGSNTGAIAGGVVGGVAALLLFAGVIWFLLRRRNRDTQPQVHPTGMTQEPQSGVIGNGSASYPNRMVPETEKQPKKWHEVDGGGVNRELDGRTRSELPGSGTRR